MKTAFSILTVMMGALAGLLTFTFMQSVDVREQLRGELSALRGDLQRASERIANLEGTNVALRAELDRKAAEAVSKEPNSPGDQSEETADTSSDRRASFESASPRAFEVPAYLGKEYLGKAWMVPQETTRKREDGGAVYEPILVLGDQYRDHFVEYRTNVVEREVAPRNDYPVIPSAYNNYYQAAAASSSSFFFVGDDARKDFFRDGRRRHPSPAPSPKPSPSPGPSQHVAMPSGGGPWTPIPRTGSIRAAEERQQVQPRSFMNAGARTQELKTPASQIGTWKPQTRPVP